MMHSLSLINRCKRSFTAVMLVMVSLLSLPSALAMKLTDIKVNNGPTESRVTLSFDGKPIYAFSR